MADKSPQAFRTIREVADWLEVEAHALRFWESKFSQIKPVKRAGGRRYYRPADMRLIGGVKVLLHDQGLTIRGVQKMIREQGIAHVTALSPPLDEDLAGAAEDPVPEDPVIEATAQERTAPRTGGFVDIEALSGATDATEADHPPAPATEPPTPDTPPAEAEAPDTASPPPPETPAPPAPDVAAPQADPAPDDQAPDDQATGDLPPTPLSELRALLHAAVPFSVAQRQQLAPMVARLDTLAARLDGHGPSA